MNEQKTRLSNYEIALENVDLLEAVKDLNTFCDKDERQPYYDIKKHANGSVYLTIRTQRFIETKTARVGYGTYPTNKERKSKKFFGKTRTEVTLAAASFVRSGSF